MPEETGEKVLHLEYPIRPRPRPRNGPLLALIEAGRARYHAHLADVGALADALARIPTHVEEGSSEPSWSNAWLPGLDAATLYTFATRRSPATYFEIGSGQSTKVVRRAIRDQGLPTRIVSIDPAPRAEVDAICDDVIRAGLEEADLSAFDRLVAGDVVFFDGSHYTYTNSDVVVFFLEVVPRLPAGVLFGVHDIFLPDDYPAVWNERYYSEQYMLSAFLLGGGAGTRIELPSWYVSTDGELASVLHPLWDRLDAGVERHGNTFWLST
jgi:hypothetical protein